MTDGARALPSWNERDIASLLTLDEVAPATYRSRYGDANLNGRSYGGQLLGQAMMAACRTAPPGRGASMMQMLFLQGALPGQSIDFHVTNVQDGKRFASRHVMATQAATQTAAARRILVAQVTFAVPLDAPTRQLSTRANTDPRGEAALADMPQEWDKTLKLLGGYSLTQKLGMDFRVPDMHEQVAPGAGNSTFHFWLKARDAVPNDPHMHSAVFAYLSDWWLNFSAVNAHTGDLRPGKRLYTSSLNHCIWLHRAFGADEWMHFDTHSPVAARGRGLAIARIHDEGGRLIASATQECLMGYAD